MTIKDRLRIMSEIEAANERHIAEWRETMLAALVDVCGSGQAYPIRVKDDLEEFYRLLDCSAIDMPTRWIGGQGFVIICDDEGLFRSDCRPSAHNGNEIMLYGNLLVVKDAGNGEIRGLTSDEVAHVLHHIDQATVVKDGRVEAWQVLNHVTYSRGR